MMEAKIAELDKTIGKIIEHANEYRMIKHNNLDLFIKELNEYAKRGWYIYIETLNIANIDGEFIYQILVSRYIKTKKE